MRFFYGWVIVAASAVVYAVLAGPLVAFGVFIKPMAAEFEWTRAATTMAFALYMITNGVVAIASGYVVDRYSPRKIVVVGGLLVGLGFFLTSRVTDLLQFYLCFSVLGGIGFGCLFVPLTATISRWFTKKKGLAIGIFYAGAGIGGLVMSPLIQSWVLNYGWRDAYVIVAVVSWCLLLASAPLIRRDPSVMGLRPLGEADLVMPELAEDEHRGRAGPAGPAGPQVYTLSGALRAKSLWIFCFATMLAFTGIMMGLVNLVPHATDVGIAETTAATALGISSAFNAGGRLGMGAISDITGTKRAASFCVFLVAILLFWLIGIRQPWMLLLFAAPFGFSYGGFLPQLPRMTVELFGPKSLGTILGINTVFASAGRALGPVVGAFIYDQTGSYRLAFLVGALAVLAAFGLVLLLKLPGKTERSVRSVMSIRDDSR